MQQQRELESKISFFSTVPANINADAAISVPAPMRSIYIWQSDWHIGKGHIFASREQFSNKIQRTLANNI